MTEFSTLQLMAHRVNVANSWTRGDELAIDHRYFKDELKTLPIELVEHWIATLALIDTETSEAIEEIRAGHRPDETYYVENKMKGVPSELADVVIRAMDFAEIWGIDLGEAVTEKLGQNARRGYKHGGKTL